MRPTARPQSALRAPLNRVFGTEASVRVLRVLSSASLPLSGAELARETDLHMSGVPRVLEQLEMLGVIESVGRGRSRPVRLREKYPLTSSIRALFADEAGRVYAVEQAIHGVLNDLKPRPVAAWVEGAFASGTDAPDDPIIIGILAETAESEQWYQQFRERCLALQTQFDVAIELRIRWRADIETAKPSALEDLRKVRPLIGPPPLDLLGLSPAEETQSRPKRLGSHALHDREALQLAESIARRLKSNPGLVDEALRFIERRSRSASKSEQLALREWADVLTTYSPARLRAFLVSDTERAIRLRQSLPFVTVLSQAERAGVRRTRARPGK